MGNISVYQWLVSLILTVGVTLIANSFFFGRRVGTMEQENKFLKESNTFLRNECALLRSAFEAYTGVSLEGVRFRRGNRGDN
jgi:hypothetical protein